MVYWGGLGFFVVKYDPSLPPLEKGRKMTLFHNPPSPSLTLREGKLAGFPRARE